MTVENPPGVELSTSTPASVQRHTTQALVGGPVQSFAGGVLATSAGGGHGVVGPDDLAVSQNGSPNMSVNVAKGIALITGTTSAAQGPYSFYNDATVNLTIAAADATNARRDLVVAQVRDGDYVSAGSARLFVVTGTPAGSPSDPAVPADCLVLARVAVAALASSITNANITDLRTRAYALGGIAVCTSTTRPSGSSLYEGLFAWETDTDRLLRYSGSAWVVCTAQGSWTPTLTNVAIGTGGSAENVGSYEFGFGKLSFRTRQVLGTSGASVSGTPRISLPSGFTAAHSSASEFVKVEVSLTAAAALREGSAVLATTSALDLYVKTVASSQINRTTITASSPATWTSGDSIVCIGDVRGSFTA